MKYYNSMMEFKKDVVKYAKKTQMTVLQKSRS